MAPPSVESNIPLFLFVPLEGNLTLLLINVKGFQKRNYLPLLYSFPWMFLLDCHLCLSVSLATLSIKHLSNLTKQPMNCSKSAKSSNISPIDCQLHTPHYVSILPFIVPFTHSWPSSNVTTSMKPSMIPPWSGGHIFLYVPATCLKSHGPFFSFHSLFLQEWIIYYTEKLYGYSAYCPAASLVYHRLLVNISWTDQ